MNAVDHNNVVIFDDRGIPSIMCRFVPFIRTSGGRYVKDGCYRGLRRRFAVRISK